MYEGSPISRAGHLLDQAAATTDQHTKHHLFNDAWRIAEEQLLGLAARALGELTGPEDRELLRDAMSEVGKKLWSAISRGYTPDHGYEAILPGLVKRSAINTIRYHRTRLANIPLRDYPTGREDDGTLKRVTEIPVNPIDAEVERVEREEEHARLQDRLVRASRRAERLGRRVASNLLAMGLPGTLTDAARRLGVTTNTLAKALAWIKENEYALFWASDARFGEYLEELEGGQACLEL